MYFSKNGPGPSCFFFCILSWKCASRQSGILACEFPKVAPTQHVFNILTWKFAACHNGVHFFDIRAWKMVRTWQFFDILTWKCASRWTSELAKVVRGWCVLYILTWICGWRHNGMQFFVPHLARWLRTRRFSEPIFRPSRTTITKHWKNIMFRDFPNISRACNYLLSSDSISFSLLLFSSLLFICPYCRKFDF